MTELKDRLKAEIECYERAKESFMLSATGKRLEHKLAKEKRRQNKNDCCCFCMRQKSADPNEQRRRLQYHKDKIEEATRNACATQLLVLKETTREVREHKSLQPKDKHLAIAHRILYAEKYRKKLLAATESQLKSKLESAISKTYQCEPLATDLHKELAQAERVLQYVARREHMRKGSTWKFDYHPQQAGYSLSYWVGSDQHWLRDRYRKCERRKESIDEEVVISNATRRVEERDNSELRNTLLNALNIAMTRRDETDIRSAISRVETNQLRHELESEIRSAEELLAELRRGPEREFGDGADEEEPIKDEETIQVTKSEDYEKLRERLHAEVCCENPNVIELRECVDLFEAANLDDIDGDLARAHRILQAQIYAEGLRHGIDDRDIGAVKTILKETDTKELKREVGKIYDEAKKYLRQMAKERLADNLVSKLKRELASAADARSLPHIKTALSHIREEGMEEKLRVEVKLAENLMRELEAERDEENDRNELDRINRDVQRLQQLLQEAIDQGEVSLLESAIKSVIESGLQDMIKAELAAANGLLDKLKEKIAFRKSVAEIPARYVSEVRSYIKPPTGVLEVMQATFLLLGFNEQELKTWKSVQTHLGKTGTDSFRYRVIKRDANVISDDVVERTMQILGEITIDNAQNLSLLVNLFYRYCQAVINETRQPHEAES